MSLTDKLIEKFSEPETKASIIHYFWIISLMMLLLGYAMIAYILFY